jgi:5'(3')-deoxyribonucleotidase
MRYLCSLNLLNMNLNCKNYNYKIVTASNPQELVDKITLFMEEGWDLIGSHHVVVVHQQNRFRGDQHMDTIHELEYSQSIIKKN